MIQLMPDVRLQTGRKKMVEERPDRLALAGPFNHLPNRPREAVNGCGNGRDIEMSQCGRDLQPGPRYNKDYSVPRLRISIAPKLRSIEAVSLPALGADESAVHNPFIWG